jgi:hypothetical protein
LFGQFCRVTAAPKPAHQLRLLGHVAGSLRDVIFYHPQLCSIDGHD